MNKELMLQVADAIERSSIPNMSFDMGSFKTPVLLPGNECGTAACIAGWTVALERGHAGLASTAVGWIEDLAARALGFAEGALDVEAHKLFWADEGTREPGEDDHERYLDQVTKEQAVWALRETARTGEVPSWPWKDSRNA